MNPPLRERHCYPVENAGGLLNPENFPEYRDEVGWEWEVIEGGKLQRLWQFRDLPSAMDFVNRVAVLAQAENHHPEIGIARNQVALGLTTRAAGGLTENDFILAAKINALPTDGAKQ